MDFESKVKMHSDWMSQNQRPKIDVRTDTTKFSEYL